MKILLIAAPLAGAEQTEQEARFWKSFYVMKAKVFHPLGDKWFRSLHTLQRQNIGMLSIAAVLRGEGHAVRYLSPDEGKPLSAHDCDVASYDIVGISCWTPNFHLAKQYAAQVKSVNPDATVVVGGPHVSFMPERALEESEDIDVLVMGEGEATIRELVQSIQGGGDLSHVKGVAYRKDGAPQINEWRERVDLATLPMPAHDLMGVDYLPASRIHFARGCPHRCSFCADIVWRKKVTFDSVDKVIDEIRWLYHKLGTRYFHVGDETFMLNKKRAVEICEKIARLDLPDLYWGCQTRIDSISTDLMDALVDARCLALDFGIESASSEVLAGVGKDYSYDKALNYLEIVRGYAHKIPGRFSFWIFALPGETEQTALFTRKEICRLIRENYLSCAEYQTFVPYPGTAIWHDIESGSNPLLKLAVGDDFMNWEKYRVQCGGYVSRPQDISERKMREIYLETLTSIASALDDASAKNFSLEHTLSISDIDSSAMEGLF